jgi:inositol phosphorylceramide mannosyltransferase catalytic subunit
MYRTYVSIHFSAAFTVVVLLAIFGALALRHLAAQQPLHRFPSGSRDLPSLNLSKELVRNLTHTLPKRFQFFLNEFEQHSCEITKVVHQTWKTELVNARYAKYISSWQAMNKGWKYSFTTNDMNRAFIQSKYPEFLQIYDTYKTDIQRADFVRYFLLYEYGGVYADIDFEALKPLDLAISKEQSCIIGQEPFEHAHVLYDVPRIICNAVMLSCPRHPFWLIVFQELVSRRHIKTVRATGPKMLSAALNKYDRLLRQIKSRKAYRSETNPLLPSVVVPSPSLFYPYFDDRNTNHYRICGQKQMSNRRRKACDRLQAQHYRNNKTSLENAIAIHHWEHTWHRQNEIVTGAHSIDSVVASAGGTRVYLL